MKVSFILCLFIIYLIFYTISLKKLLIAELRNINTNTELLLKLSQTLTKERSDAIKFSRPLMINTKALEKEVLDGARPGKRSYAKSDGDRER